MKTHNSQCIIDRTCYACDRSICFQSNVAIIAETNRKWHNISMCIMFREIFKIITRLRYFPLLIQSENRHIIETHFHTIEIFKMNADEFKAEKI